MRRLICWLRGYHDEYAVHHPNGDPTYYECQRCGAPNSRARHMEQLARKRARWEARR